MLFDIANTLSALRTWRAFVDVKDVILKAWRHLFEDTKDWDRSSDTFFSLVYLCCQLQYLSFMRTINITWDTLQTDERLCDFQIYTEDLEGYKVARCKKKKKNDLVPHWQSKGVRIEDKAWELQKMSGTIRPFFFFFTTQIRIKTTKCNSFPLSNPYFMIIPHSKTLEKVELPKESCSIFLPLAPC